MKNNIDFELVKASLSGDKDALNTLVEKYNGYVFNICLKTLYSHKDAQDVSQEIWIKIITRLDTFQFKSAFSTWLYKIAVNHMLDMSKKSVEQAISKGFAGYKDNLEGIANETLTVEEEAILKEALEEAKISCMSGMLMCLDREQRLIYVLGDIFKIDHKLGSEIFAMSPVNYRQKLSRARKELFNFMNNQCSLVNRENPCTCSKKTKGFIKRGYVNPDKLIFNRSFKEKIYHHQLVHQSDELDRIKEDYHTQLFRQHPFEETAHKNLLEEILIRPEIKNILKLD
ncbi:RNA polymerase ECF-type sigma factor, putative [Fulvivirga imtechensis AK7]|uniref:RNA polymerase ECF-type sigma factor, putative n=1 Tax=Fulvivirga imtechensis AK7 TaxID=1237149 RepID=L8JL24_9BACT|nr:RNA polymerase sigma factor [Fulvivirga imtechensis]ELR69505.1 RNA polymerase ECF-type sigma factor, putative [Fulvivirga imtechensis AK7]